MTKRTQKLLEAVFEYCINLAAKSRREGILALEEFCYEKGLTEEGKVLFTRKVDRFIKGMLRILVDGAYTTEINKHFLERTGRFCTKGTRLILNVASVCLDAVANGTHMVQLISQLGVYVGAEELTRFDEIRREVESRYTDDYEFELTDEHKERINQINVFFKMKEDECLSVLKKKNEKLTELHVRVPEFPQQQATVRLVYKPKGRSLDDQLFWEGIPKSSWLYIRDMKGQHFIGELPVCESMWEFWNKCSGHGPDVDKFMKVTEDVPNNLEKYLTVVGTMDLMEES